MNNNRVESAECLDIVRFRVSEYIYTCHKTTILKHPDSKLAELIKPENDKRKSGSDMIVIDRNGKIFGLILKLMRGACDRGSFDPVTCDINDITRELEFFRLAGLKRYVLGDNGGSYLSELRTLDGSSKSIGPFDKPTIVVESRSVGGLTNTWRQILKKVLTVDLFDICINDFQYNSKSASKVTKTEKVRSDYGREEMRTNTYVDPQEYFRLYQSERSHQSLYGYRPPKLFDKKPDDFEEELLYSGNYVENSKGNFLRFLIAIEMYGKATTAAELLDIEESIPGVRFKRYPMPEEESINTAL